MLDEVLMLGNKAFIHLNLSLQDIKAMPDVFGGISVILRSGLLQLSPVQQ